MPWILTVEEPPAAYVHRYRGHVIERVLPLAEARRICAFAIRPAPAPSAAPQAITACDA